MRLAKVAILLLFSVCQCSAETHEQAVLRHLIDAAPNGFAGLRGEKQSEKPRWTAVTTPVGAENCVVDWSENSTNHVELRCLMLEEAGQAEAEREFLRIRDLVASVVPWKDARRTPPAQDSFRIFFEPHPEGSDVRRTIVVRYNPDDEPGKYYVQLQIGSAIAPATASDTAEKAKSNMAEWVAEDVLQYVADVAKGFESYKKGDPTTRPDGIRSWDSSRQPLLATRCEVQQRGQTNSLLCVLTQSAYKGELEVQYRELVADVAAALPDGWATTVNPPFTDAIASKGFVSSQGATGQIWIAFDSDTEQYSLIYRIVPNSNQDK